MSATATNATISIDRFRRRTAADTSVETQAPDQHELVGRTLGVIDRRYGLMSSSETIVISEVIASSGDLAVADRLAFVASVNRHCAIAVVEYEGWYLACVTERELAAAELPQLRQIEADAPRLMSLASERGITPSLGPLCA